jgi:HD-GYP domain-containing protein (c-di-GMP phosphodiesterase class II)
VRHSVLVYATVAAGLGIAVAGALAAADRPLTALALLGAAALAAELLEEPESARVREPVGPGVFRVASGVDLAAVIVLGPWRGALVAGSAALLARLVRGTWRHAAFQAAAFALASVAAGYAFSLGGGRAGHLALPDDLVPLTVLALVYLLISRGLLQIVGDLEVLQPDFAAAAAEAGLGAILALFALGHPWNVLAVVPVALAVNRAHARVRRSRQETLHALETFANIVDERDPSTYRHSIRVAGYVDSLARALGLPYSDIDRLRWAARLHDLGKVAVDAAVLGKSGKLTPAEWGTVWRAPRLSARLLRRFEISADEARAVEYHRERFDGRGYYAIPAEDQPLAAHFLVVADSFDAMISDRPYRPGLSKEEALAEIERNTGTQFHPAVAKAFVALQRGRDPYETLSKEERDELGGSAVPYRIRRGRPSHEVRERPELIALAGVVAGLGGVGLDQVWLGAAGATVACMGLALQGWLRFRSNRLVRALATALAGEDRERVFDKLSQALETATGSDWVALVSWEEEGLGGSIDFSRGDERHERALLSWLAREVESREELLLAPGHEFGGEDAYVALPLRRENSALTGFLVLRTPRLPQRFVQAALSRSLDGIGLALAGGPEAARELATPSISASAG